MSGQIDPEDEQRIVLGWMVDQAEDGWRLYQGNAFFKTAVDEALHLIVPALVSGLAAQARNAERLQAELFQRKFLQDPAPPVFLGIARLRLPKDETDG